MSGLTATQGTRRRPIASRIADTARIGSIETNGLLGARRSRSAAAIASSTPGAGVAVSAPSKRTASTSSRCPRATNHSWNGNSPAGVSIHVRRRSSVAGSSGASTPNAAASRAVTLESGSPMRSACVRTRCRPRSRSPSWNHASPPSVATLSSARQRLAGASPAACFVVGARERVEDRVEVGRDVQPEHLDVVADVADDGDVRRRRRVDDALHEARAADAAREDDELHARRSSRARRGTPACAARSGAGAARGRRACRRPRRGSGSRRSTVSPRSAPKRRALPGP